MLAPEASGETHKKTVQFRKLRPPCSGVRLIEPRELEIRDHVGGQLSLEQTTTGTYAQGLKWHTWRPRISQVVTGNVTGLKALQRKSLERIYRRAIPPDEVVTLDLARYLAELSRELRRQVGVLVDRRGRIRHVVVGDTERLFLPDLGRQRAGRGRFRGLRLIHTHIAGEKLSRDDLTDLSLLQLDLIAVIQADDRGQAASIEFAHLVPPRPSGELWEIAPPVALHELELD